MSASMGALSARSITRLLALNEIGGGILSSVIKVRCCTLRPLWPRW